MWHLKANMGAPKNKTKFWNQWEVMTRGKEEAIFDKDSTKLKL